VNALTQQSFCLLVLQKIFEGVVDVLALINTSDKSLEIFIIVVDGLKKLEKTINDLHVRLTETFIQLDSFNACLNSLIESFLCFEIFEAEKDTLIAAKLFQDE
jgi:hypothetical protein